MTDIAERIRNASLTPMGIAADEIERLRKENEFLKEENFSLMLKISRQKSPEVKAKIIAKSLGIKTTGGK